MTESRPGEELEQRMEEDAGDMDHRLDQLGEHIDDAREKADARAGEAKPLEDTAGDWEDTESGPMVGDDPEGAFDDPDAEDEQDDEV